MTKHIVTLGLLLMALCLGAGYLLGQQHDKPKSKEGQMVFDLLTGEMEIQLDKPNASTKLAEAYMRSANDPALSNTALAYALGQFYKGKFSARSAPQVSQVADEASIRLLAIQAAQNQRIIELLDKLTAQKK